MTESGFHACLSDVQAKVFALTSHCRPRRKFCFSSTPTLALSRSLSPCLWQVILPTPMLAYNDLDGSQGNFIDLLTHGFTHLPNNYLLINYQVSSIKLGGHSEIREMLPILMEHRDIYLSLEQRVYRLARHSKYEPLHSAPHYYSCYI